MYSYCQILMEYVSFEWRHQINFLLARFFRGGHASMRAWGRDKDIMCRNIQKYPSPGYWLFLPVYSQKWTINVCVSIQHSTNGQRTSFIPTSTNFLTFQRTLLHSIEHCWCTTSSYHTVVFSNLNYVCLWLLLSFEELLEIVTGARFPWTQSIYQV